MNNCGVSQSTTPPQFGYTLSDNYNSNLGNFHTAPWPIARTGYDMYFLNDGNCKPDIVSCAYNGVGNAIPVESFQYTQDNKSASRTCCGANSTSWYDNTFLDPRTAYDERQIKAFGVLSGCTQENFQRLPALGINDQDNPWSYTARKL